MIYRSAESAECSAVYFAPSALNTTYDCFSRGPLAQALAVRAFGALSGSNLQI